MKATIAASILAIFAGGALVFATRQPSAKTNVKTGSAAADDASRLCTFGTAPFGYDVELKDTLHVSFGSGADMTFPIHGRLVIAPLVANATGQVLAAKFERVEGTGVDLEPLRAPFLIEVSPQCEVIAFARHKDAVPDRARQEQILAEEFSTVLASAQRGNAGLQAIGRGKDAQGEFTQNYAMSAQGDAVHINATNRQYERVWAGGLPTRVQSASETTFDFGPWLLSASSERTFESRGGERTFNFKAMRVMVEAASAAQIPMNENDYVWGDLLPKIPIVAAAGQPTPEDADEIRLLTTPEAKQKYVDLFGSQAHIGAAGTFLRNYAEAHPAFAYEILKDVKDGTLKGMPAATVFPALQLVRNKEARLALTSLHGDADTVPFDKARSAMALASRPDATSEFVTSLTNDAANVGAGNFAARFGSGEALLALGMVVNYGAPAVRDQAKGVLLEHAASAIGFDQIAPVVGGVANTGDPDFLVHIRRWTRDPDDQVRYLAATSFRRMPVEKTEELQTAWIAAEADLRVKGAIYDAAWKQAFDQLRPAAKAIIALAIDAVKRNDDNFTLRQNLIRVLGEAAKSDEAAAVALGDMYAIEPNADLRVMIGQYVKSEYLKQRVLQ
jgi:hypothetical protein